MTIEENKKVGAVLVIGGGIGGIQASLDLANSGFKVYMVERDSAIGGHMAELDKTFPTGDCSMCMISPKLVEANRHLNIEMLTLSEVLELKGAAGDFTAKVLKHPRYIDLAKCVGCGECAKVCPIKDRPDSFNKELSYRTATYRNFPQAVPGAYVIDKAGKSPCRFGCPLGVNAHAYVALIADGRFAEALEVEKRQNPFPAICGRVCTHGCENDCRRGDLDEPVDILNLKRFLADWESKQAKLAPPEIKEKHEEKVAIIGSGPAGLSAARELAILGYNITVFEKQPVAGGMLALAIPSFRLSKDVLNLEIASIRDLGVEIKTNTAIGPGLTLDDLRKQGYKAIFIATGASKGLKLKIAGEDEYQGVLDCLDFLARINLSQQVSPGKNVVVIGGGNAAIDAARSAWRLGAEQITVVYNRTQKEMPAYSQEIEAALEEGIKLQFLAKPVKILGSNGKVTGVQCIRMKLSKPDPVGRSRPIPVKGSEFILDADTVISASAREPDLSFISPDQGFKISSLNLLKVHAVTLQTNQPGIFAGGDAVSGPSSVIEAIGMGQRVAESIHRHLRGIDLLEGRKQEPPPLKAIKDIAGLPVKMRQKMPKLPVQDRRDNFKEVLLGYTEEMAVEEAKRCLDCAVCSECMLCVKACQALAVQHDQLESVEELNVGAVILSTGCSIYNPRVRGELGFGRYPNVVTSIQFERILSASGPFQGVIQRPSDGHHPKKVAWIQCVGSRDEHIKHGWCSSVCCMYATKQTIIAKEHDSDMEPTIFYMDLRAHGKDFDRYVERAKNQYGVRYLRSMISGIKQSPKTKNLKISYNDESGKPQQEEFDMVVLSVGFEPHGDAERLAKTFGIDLNDDRFAATGDFTPVCTSKPGIFVTGIFQQPKDIPETVMMGSAAAGGAATMLAKARGTEVTPKQYPPERDIQGEEPRIGVFICHCGINIASTVDVAEVANMAKELPNVVHAENVMYACSQDTQENMKKVIKENGLNRVVVASCTPRTHMPLFQETMKEAGLNPYLFEMANIREQDSWVHMGQREVATKKAKQLVKMTIAKSRLLAPLPAEEIHMTPSALIIGGGAAGLSAALSLGEQGFPVHLVERSDLLGGNMRFLHSTLNGGDVQKFMIDLITRVNEHPNIKVHLETEIKKIGGYVGNYVTQLTDGATVEHGIVLLATGGVEYRPTEYLYGQDKRIITQLELENAINNGSPPKSKENFVMIQCVGSRDDEHPYCSRVCCSTAVKNAISIKKMQPDANVTVLYRDIRTYGFKEHYYYKAREMGVQFIHYDPERKPEVQKRGDKLVVRTYESQLGSYIELPADRLVLSAAIRPPEGVKEISDALKVTFNEDGFFLEVHVKLRPVDFASEGLFLAGLAHAPKGLDETIAQAQAAAGRAGILLSHDRLKVSGIVSEINMEKCAVCLNCVRTCPYDAPFINADGKVEINQVKCQGCGLCVATCPAKALQLRGFTDAQIIAQVDAFAELMP